MVNPLDERQGAGAAQAEAIARTAHEGQFRRDGVTPYITHPAAVASMVALDGEEVVMAAWLHDVLEDTPWTADDLRVAGVPGPVVEAVVILTKTEGVEYLGYLQRVRTNPIARRVKIADMLHNLATQPKASQVTKYSQGLAVLLGLVPASPGAGGS